jgi:DNA-binding MarR family transcriptional regulator
VSDGRTGQRGPAQSSQAQGTHTQGTQAEGEQTQGTHTQGTLDQGAQAQGAYTQGTQDQGAHTQGTQDQGAQSPDEQGQAQADEQRASQVVMILLRLFRALERVDTDLTPQQYRILKLAGAGGERSAKLAERLAVAKPTLTATADGLVAAGFARRDAEPGDRRVVRLCLTPSGHEAIDRADAAYGQWLDQLLAETSAPDQVLSTLDALNEAMDEVRRARHATRPEPARQSRPARTSALNAAPLPTLAAPPAGRRATGRGSA